MCKVQPGSHTLCQPPNSYTTSWDSTPVRDRVGPGQADGTHEELKVDANLRVEITTDETSLVKLVFSGTPDVGFPLQAEVRDIPGEVVRRVWNGGLRDHEIA